MYCQRDYQCVLLLLTLIAAVVTSQSLSQGCLDARAAILADQVCLDALNRVETVIVRGAAISDGALNNFAHQIAVVSIFVHQLHVPTR